jgi:hypothetical protein
MGRAPLIRTPPPGRAPHLAHRHQRRDRAHGEGHQEHRHGALLRDVQRQVGGRGRLAVQPPDDGHAGQVAEHGQDRRLLQHDAGDEAVPEADGAQRGVLVDMLGDVGEQDLVDDDGADHETHDGAEGEDVADRRGRVPVALSRAATNCGLVSTSTSSGRYSRSASRTRSGSAPASAGSGRAGCRCAGAPGTGATSCRRW